MAKGKKFYVVWKGRKTGVFDTWDACSAQVTGYVGAEYKSFERREDAQRAFAGKYADYKGTTSPKRVTQARLMAAGNPVTPSYAVDAACSGNPGVLEYRGVDVQTKAVLFHEGPFDNGTNNIGEFLAIVHALALLKERGIALPIYSDSKHAISWVKARKCGTKLLPDSRNAALFDLIARAESWLKANQYDNRILKWETDVWGEIPADFGRK
jgi:ribonuclease HI